MKSVPSGGPGSSHRAFPRGLPRGHPTLRLARTPVPGGSAAGPRRQADSAVPAPSTQFCTKTSASRTSSRISALTRWRADVHLHPTCLPWFNATNLAEQSPAIGGIQGGGGGARGAGRRRLARRAALGGPFLARRGAARLIWQLPDTGRPLRPRPGQVISRHGAGGDRCGQDVGVIASLRHAAHRAQAHPGLRGDTRELGESPTWRAPGAAAATGQRVALG